MPLGDDSPISNLMFDPGATGEVEVSEARTPPL